MNQRYRIADLQQEYGITRKTVFNWIKKGILRKPDIQTGRFTMWEGQHPREPNQNTTASA